MNESDIKHFLLVLDPTKPEPEVRALGTDYDFAVEAYNEAEARFRTLPEIEVVLLSADSIETIRRTHSSYFESKTGDPIEKLLSSTS